MNRNTWRQLASGLLAATLSLGIAACDDDTSSGTGDMAVGADMSASVDMTMTGTPGIGQIVLADVVGTAFTPTQVAPRTHALVAIASMPKIAPMSDPSSDLTLSPPSGCTINRYTMTNPPGPDGDAGLITISGRNQQTIGISAITGTASSGPTMYPITCARGGAGTLMDYGCGFGGTANSDGGGMGMSTDSVIFPLIKHRVVDHMTQGTIINVTLPDWPAAFDSSCVERVCAVNVMPAPSPACAGLGGCDVICCEQTPILVGTSNITETIAGGTDYGAATNMLGNKDNTDAGITEFPQPVYLISVTQTGSATNLAGTDPLTGGPSLSMADAAIDKTKDLTLSFSCDQSGTVGSGCTGTSDLGALLVKTSTSARTLFGVSTATGSAQCISTLTAGTIKIKAAQLTALVGTQTTGSYQLALARLRLIPATDTGHTLVYSGGMGVFGFTNQ
jgi:hypothetical protein